jgi:hypothetical protein
MKATNLKIVLFLLLINSLMGCRSDGSGGPKEKSPLPSLTMRLMDTTSFLNTDQIKAGAPLVIIYFSPDCSHCREETRQLLSHMDMFRNVHILLLTPMPYDDLVYFYKEFNLKSYSNLTVGQDDHLSFYHYFNPRQIPYTAIYDSGKKLSKVIIGFSGINNILESIRG